PQQLLLGAEPLAPEVQAPELPVEPRLQAPAARQGQQQLQGRRRSRRQRPAAALRVAARADLDGFAGAEEVDHLLGVPAPSSLEHLLALLSYHAAKKRSSGGPSPGRGSLPGTSRQGPSAVGRKCSTCARPARPRTSATARSSGWPL